MPDQCKCKTFWILKFFFFALFLSQTVMRSKVLWADLTVTTSHRYRLFPCAVVCPTSFGSACWRIKSCPSPRVRGPFWRSCRSRCVWWRCTSPWRPSCPLSLPTVKAAVTSGPSSRRQHRLLLKHAGIIKAERKATGQLHRPPWWDRPLQTKPRAVRHAGLLLLR